MGISVWQLLIILLIVVLLFGTKKLRSIGKDMGGAVKGFRDAMAEGEGKEKEGAGGTDAEGGEHRDASRIIEGEVASKDDEKV